MTIAVQFRRTAHSTRATSLKSRSPGNGDSFHGKRERERERDFELRMATRTKAPRAQVCKSNRLWRWRVVNQGSYSLPAVVFFPPPAPILFTSLFTPCTLTELLPPVYPHTVVPTRARPYICPFGKFMAKVSTGTKAPAPTSLRISNTKLRNLATKPFDPECLNIPLEILYLYPFEILYLKNFSVCLF